jgi:hypothetical protein
MQIRQNYTDVNGRNVTTEWSSPLITDPTLRLILHAKSYGNEVYEEWYKAIETCPTHELKIASLIKIIDAKNISTQI